MKIDNSLNLMSLNDTKLDLNNKDDVALKRQTDNFEAVFLKMVLDKSLKTENHLVPKGVGEDIYKSMYNDALSKDLSGGFGFSQMLFNFLKQNY
jgi:Rod binding domain-containing protein